MFLALFSNRWFRPSGVRAIEIVDYERGKIVVNGGEHGFSAVSSPDGGQTIYYGYGTSAFEALGKLLTAPSRLSNLPGFYEEIRSAHPIEPAIEIVGLTSSGIYNGELYT
jgi:hypothetical protein